MNNRVIITNYNNKLLVAKFDNDKMNHISFFDADEESIGTVYLCRVTKVLSNINGAFIQYQKGCNGFIKGTGYKPEQILALQLKKEGTNNKEPLFTDNISLSSPYVIINRGAPHISVSSKLSDDTKKHYIGTFKYLSSEYGLNIIIRTNAIIIDDDALKQNIDKLYEQLQKIEHSKDNRTLYSVLYRPEKSYIKELLDFKQDTVSEIITNIPSIYDELKQLQSVPIDTDKSVIGQQLLPTINIKFYDDKMLSLFHLFKMEHNIKNATDNIIPLKSGAEIVINRTEALTAIDINTHNSTISKDIETTFFETNKEAAREIVRQLQIRNISGMIIIDFINMKQDKHYQELFDYLCKLSIDDPVGLKVIDITGLKLVELVRTKRRKTLLEQMR